MTGADEAAVAERAKVLSAAVEAALPLWVERSVERLLMAWAGQVDPAVMAEARTAGQAAQSDVGGRMRALLETDIDEQRSGPLAVLRSAVAYPTAVLRAAGVPPVERDAFSEEHFPGDDYDLTPATFADLDPALHEPGLGWGAAKAWAHRRRHLPRPESEDAR